MAIATGNFVGRPIPRTEAALKASGAISYTADICIPNVLHAMLVSSPIARGRIRSVDTTAAEALPGVVRVFTPETMPRLPSVPEQPDWDIMYGSSFVPTLGPPFRRTAPHTCRLAQPTSAQAAPRSFARSPPIR